MGLRRAVEVTTRQVFWEDALQTSAPKIHTHLVRGLVTGFAGAQTGKARTTLACVDIYITA